MEVNEGWDDHRCNFSARKLTTIDIVDLVLLA